MADEGTSFRAALILIIAAILIIATFSFLTVVYPTGPATGTQAGGPFQLFQTPSNDSNGLGQNVTGFRSTSQKLVRVEGYLKNNSSGAGLPDSKFIVAVFPEETVNQTDSNGYYQYYVRYTGSGSFAYEVPGYETKIVPITVSAPAVWKNVSLNPYPKYQISGNVTDIYGNRIAAINMTFTNHYQNLYQKFYSQSNLTGFFSIRLYNDSYWVAAGGTEYITNNTSFTVHGAAVHDFNVSLTPNVPSPVNISGYARNSAGVAVTGAKIFTFPIINSTVTNSKGYYSIDNLYGVFNITAFAPGYNSTFQREDLSSLAAGARRTTNVSLDPVASIGRNLVLFNTSSHNQTGDPSVNFTTLLSSLANYSIAGPRTPGPAVLDLSLSSGGTAMNNTSSLVYVDSNGIFYRGIFSTNSTGQVVMQLNFSGFYGLAVLTLYGGINATGRNFNGTVRVGAKFPVLQRHNLSILAVNEFDNIAVPGTGLSCNNSLLPVPGYFIQVSNTTYFNYTLPNGTYMMLYSSPGFANYSFSATVAGNNTSLTAPLYPFTVLVMNVANLTWNVTLSTSGYVTNFTLPAGGNSSLQIFAARFVIQAVALNGSFMVRKSFNISSTTPVRIVYLNQTYANASANATSASCTFDNVTGVASGIFKLNLTLPSQVLLTGVSLLSLNFTPTDSTISVGNLNMSFNGSYLNFTSPFLLTGGSNAVSFSSAGLNASQGEELCKLLTIWIVYSYVVVNVTGLG